MLLHETNVTAIPDYFLDHCDSFNSEITLVELTISIGDYFMYESKSFNQPFEFPLRLESIGEGFMSYSKSFDQDIVIPALVKHIGDDFMYAYKAWHKSKLTNLCSVDVVTMSFESVVTMWTIVTIVVIILIVAFFYWSCAALDVAVEVCCEVEVEATSFWSTSIYLEMPPPA